MEKTMKAAYLPGNSTVVLKDVPVPQPGHGEVLVRMKSSTICGSDIRTIYREHPDLGSALGFEWGDHASLRRQTATTHSIQIQNRRGTI